MAEDYDARRKPKGSVEELETDSLEELQIRRSSPATATIDIDYADGFELPEDQIPDDISVFSEEGLTMPVIPMQVTEFRCSLCFLVHPIRRRAYDRNEKPICTDCA